jgi:hypothetical protein
MHFLRTTNVKATSGEKIFGMGYRPASPRNMRKRVFWPTLGRLLSSKGVIGASTDDNKTGTKPFFGRVFNQNITGSCTNASTMKACRISLVSKGLMPQGVEDFSPRKGYAQTRQIERGASIVDPNQTVPGLQDVGAEPDDCITSVQDLGVAPIGAIVPEGYYDCNASNVNDEVTLSDEEKTILLPGAADVDLLSSSRIEEWKAAIPRNIGMTNALFVDEDNVMNWDPNKGPITKINLNDPRGGGHQICGPVGWYTLSSLGLCWIFGNSWDVTYGIDGFLEITDSCLMTSCDNSIAYDVAIASSAGIVGRVA